MSIVLILQNWLDEYLRWNVSEYDGIDKLMLPLEKMWVPDLVVENR